MRSISTHVLDLVAGRPASGIAVTLEVQEEAGTWRELASRTTDADGRVSNLLPAERSHTPATAYRLRFAVGDYFAARGIASFYPHIEVTFTAEREEHYHVPLLLSPFGYTTYRGS